MQDMVQDRVQDSGPTEYCLPDIGSLLYKKHFEKIFNFFLQSTVNSLIYLLLKMFN